MLITMEMKRVSGILLHPTSLPGPHGIGDLGAEAYRFVDFLAGGKQALWQILPLGPTGVGDSPYAAVSSFAGNPLLISLDKLVEAGDLTEEDIANPPEFDIDRVRYEPVTAWKKPLLEKAARTFLNQASETRQEQFKAFCAEQAYWLDDFALFLALKEGFDANAKFENAIGTWNVYWPEDIRLRHENALHYWRERKDEAIAINKVIQFYFYQQWWALRWYANQHGVTIVGDIPIFVAEDSADVWADRDLFLLDNQGRPTVVAGIPPDYFSQTGQRWGNPLYNWHNMEHRGFRWWLSRLRATLNLVDVVRIDHFRAFDTYWAIPAYEPTAVHGRWDRAPGYQFFETVKMQLGELPIVVEDLGIIPDDVRRLRDHFNFPGMKILQFAFSGLAGGLDPSNPYLPHNHRHNAIVYTGTHDNDTTLGWYKALPEWDKNAIQNYLMHEKSHIWDSDIVWVLMQLAWSSVCNWSIIPMQDLLRLDSDARMNIPGQAYGNWQWRFRAEALNEWTEGILRDSAYRFGRAHG
ncbi:MAG TPA: 4-alpha-glucanotransferase [Anaerolineae bacterium]|nr:4-alpha-glucanotransferase [Anaerolineae bacterium]